MADTSFLNEMRLRELALIRDVFPPSGRVLELGAGTGIQARALTDQGYDVAAVDVSVSHYAGARVFDVVDYDGAHLPFGDGEFDVVFSSNVLEHVRDLDGMHREMRRVLKPGGLCIHAMPTPAWRAWTLFTAPIGVLGYALAGFTPRNPPRGVVRVLWRAVQPWRLLPHGERGNAITELVIFGAGWWRQVFRRNGFEIIAERPVGLFYTGAQLLGARLPLSRRRTLAPVLGSACRLYVTRAA